MNNEKYNGYTNYETWIVALWIDNDEGSQTYWQERGQELIDDREPEDRKDGDKPAPGLTSELAGQLKDELHDNAPELEGFWTDLLNAALSEVDWDDVAENILLGCELDAEAAA